MAGAYIGKLEHADPLYDYLAGDVLPRLDLDVIDPVFHVSRMRATNLVYGYVEEATGASLIGKFYTQLKPYKAERLKMELANLSMARAIGLVMPPNSVVRPLGSDPRTGLGLLMEFVQGRDLDHYVRRAVNEGRDARLMQRLGELAGFLAELHIRTDSFAAVDIDPHADYFDKVVDKLVRRGLVDKKTRSRLMRLKDKWTARSVMRADHEVMLHGDATPTNFIFPAGAGVVAIDLERMRAGDRMFDVGMICGELKHAYMWMTGDRFASEPFIGHFLREYAARFGADEDFFRELTARNPFYMGLTELRIARNDWLDYGHRKRLVSEAIRCLTHGLELR